MGIVTTYFCQVCQEPFQGRSGKGGRAVCGAHQHLAGRTTTSLLHHIGHLEGTLREKEEWQGAAVQRLQSVVELEAANAALKKRVAELENEKAEVSEYAAELAAMVGDLQSQLEARDKRVAELEARLLQLDVCWHCRDCLLPASKPRCEHCPDECDVKGCDAPGCREHSALSRIELPEGVSRD